MRARKDDLSVVGGQFAGIVLRAQPGGADRRDHGEKLLERHLQVQESTLAEDPSVVIENFVRNRNRQLRKSTDCRKRTRIGRMNGFKQPNPRLISLVFDY